MQRICSSLAENGYMVTLVGRKLSSSLPLQQKRFQQKRLRCFFKKGKLFYAEYNLRLFFFLLFRKMDAVCAIDLDTILPCLYISKWKKIPRIYDAHELFTGLKEVATRPLIRKIWTWVEKKAAPQYKYGYTVSASIADEFNKRYGVKYATIRNMTKLREFTEQPLPEKFLLYQGAVNEARAFEQLIPAMKQINCKLVICGDGNFMNQLKELIRQNGIENKVELKGMLSPDDLWTISQKATIGMGVAENTGINQYLALPNKFFDYIHAGLPQIAMNFPEYQQLNKQFEVAILLDDISPERIAGAVNNLLQNDVLYNRLRQNCFQARQVLNWQQEEKKLLDFYQSVFHS
ncbi:MAG: glycosyltransferase [Chitinophagaceae bacterium]|nr:glycosyltransferase [Chitinophagaceae bacterium]